MGGGSVQVFAVEDRSVQLTWSSLPSTGLTIEVGDQSLPVGSAPPAWYTTRLGRRSRPGTSGPGAVTIGGLEPGTEYDVCLSGRRLARRKVATATTLRPPPGRLLARFATVSDCHIGESHLGALKVLHDPSPRPAGLIPYPERCARAAVSQCVEWGAELLAVKGDLTAEGGSAEVEAAIDMLRTAGVPVEVVLGNHDVRGPVDVAAALCARGIPGSTRPRAVDLPGARLVMGHSPVPHHHAGRVPGDHARQLAELAGAASGPAVVILHHPPRRRRIETKYPPSIGHRDSSRLTEALAATNPAVLILAGHTHRNRFYRVGGVPVAEVGATKDYPGQWAGYTVHEGGIRQVVYRIALPEAIAWTEMTRRAIGGLWGLWSPGRLSERCWTLEWPSRPPKIAAPAPS
ncbi:MAG: metallophosphoesterase family protein [Acidimicrobiales bacterium]